MDDNRDAVAQLESLAFWGGPIEVEPLLGGITNANYLVRSGAATYVARLCADRPALGIDRINEVASQREAHARRVAPEVVHHEPGVLISAHVPGRTLSPENVCNPDFIPRIAALLRRLHDGRSECTSGIREFSGLQTVLAYAQTARGLNAELPGELESLLDDARGLDWTLGPFKAALCHNDLLATNILDDRDRLWLVDWEYAGLGRPLFDLANIAANNALPDEFDRTLLSAYRGHLDPRELRELRILKTLSYLRESLWGAIQTVASDIAFDYRGYSQANFQAYREARRRLDV